MPEPEAIAADDLWGTTWTPAEVNAADFGTVGDVRYLSSTNNSGSSKREGSENEHRQAQTTEVLQGVEADLRCWHHFYPSIWQAHANPAATRTSQA
jgi:hypothetical protein